LRHEARSRLDEGILMPLPATTDEFLDLVQKSAVVEDKRFSAYVEKLRAGGSLPSSPRQIAELLLRDGILTNFQAEQILQGKWKRFTIGKYKVLERLGAGGMGSVYLCEHKLMRRRVAVKVLPTAKAEDPSSLERFYREARAVAALDHPNIVRAYDIDEDNKLHFLVMEHVDGASLQEIIKKNGPMDVVRACHYIRQAALGLQHAHETANIVHRDIKPGNILVDRSGIVKVLDMGLARFFNDEEDILTKKYDENVLGTADYLAPEQATDSHAVDIRADIYSLGATFYFCLTARTPFQEGTVAQKLIWHQTRLPKPIRSFRPEVPDGVIALIDKSMAKDAAARFQSPLEMAEALSEWTKTPIPPPPENEMPKLSLAAMGAPNENSFAATSKPVSPSPSPRKAWQVPTTPSPGLLPKQNPAPIAQAPAALTAPAARAAPAVASPLPAPRPSVAPQAKPQPATNGVPRPQTPTTVTAPPVPTTKDRLKTVAVSGAARLKTSLSLLETLAKRPLLVTIGLVLLILFSLLAGAVILSAFLPKHPAANIIIDGSRPPKVYTKTNANGDPVDFKDFLAKATSGERIILQDNVEADDVTITVKHLTIEGEPSREIIWRYSDKSSLDGTLLRTNSAEGLVIKGITFDGDNRAKTLLNLYGNSPGLTLKNLHFKNFKTYGIHVTNCEGSPDRYIDMNGLTFETKFADQICLYFDILEHSKGPIPFDRYFRIHDCRFSGPGTNGKLSSSARVQYMEVQKDLEQLDGKNR
jgi:eukaryotic-like serine/threonine-protein kinase